MRRYATTRSLTPRPTVRCLNAYDDLFRGVDHDNIASIHTSTLTSSVTAGETVLPLASVAGLAVGELIYVDPDSDDFDTAVVTDITSLNVTVTPALTYGHASGVQCGQLWGNSTHVFGNGGDVFGRFLANAITSQPSGPIVVLGDSWAVDTGPEWLAFVASIAARYPALSVINEAVSGNRLDQMNTRFAADVAPHAPALVVHMSGFANDIAAGRTQAQTTADILTLVGLCRAIDADLLMAGVAPLSDYAAAAATAAPIYRAYANAFVA